VTEHICRHRVPAIGAGLDDWYDNLVAFVGWDRALNTFFFQIGPADPDDPNEIDGERFREISELLVQSSAGVCLWGAR
jgi:hypothetical protein